MMLTEKQTSLIKDLQSQEKLCIDKYAFYASQASDTELKNLFNKIQQEEQKHYNSLSEVLNGSVPAVQPGDSEGANYNPTASYNTNSNASNKEHDQFLCTDSITTEKYVSSAYNDDLFQFGDTNIRKLLNDIQTEEQNHAEMIYKYKQVNGMV